MHVYRSETEKKTEDDDDDDDDDDELTKWIGCSCIIQLYRISASPEIRPSPAPVKFLAEFGGCSRSCSTFS